PAAQGVEVLAVRVPAAEADGGETNAGFDQTASSQGALAERGHAVPLAKLLRLLIEVEGVAGLVGAEDFERLLVEGIEPADEGGIAIGFRERFIEIGQEGIAVFELFEGEAGGERDAAGGEVGGGRRAGAAWTSVRSAFDDERIVGGAEVAGLACGA